MASAVPLVCIQEVKSVPDKPKEQKRLQFSHYIVKKASSIKTLVRSIQPFSSTSTETDSPFINLPDELIKKIMSYLSAREINILMPLHSKLKRIALDHYNKPCTNLLVQRYFGENSQEQSSFITAVFLEYFNLKRTQCILKQQNIPKGLINEAHNCPLVTAAILRKQSNLGHIKRRRIHLINIPTYTTTIKEIDPHKKLLATAHTNGETRIWCLASEQAELIKTCHSSNSEEPITFIANPTPNSLYTGSCALIERFDRIPRHNQPLQAFSEHRDNLDITTIQLITDLPLIFVSGYKNGSAIIWKLLQPDTTTFQIMHRFSFCETEIHRFSVLNSEHITTFPCFRESSGKDAAHKKAFFWRLDQNHQAELLANLRFSRNVKSFTRLDHGRLVATTDNCSHITVLNSDFLQHQLQTVDWFEVHAGQFENEIYNSDTRSTALLDGRLATIGAEHIYIWEPSHHGTDIQPSLSIPFPPNCNSSSPRRNFSLFTIQNGQFLVVALEKMIEIWDLIPGTQAEATQ